MSDICTVSSTNPTHIQATPLGTLSHVDKGLQTRRICHTVFGLSAGCSQNQPDEKCFSMCVAHSIPTPSHTQCFVAGSAEGFDKHTPCSCFLEPPEPDLRKARLGAACFGSARLAYLAHLGPCPSNQLGSTALGWARPGLAWRGAPWLGRGLARASSLDSARYLLPSAQLAQICSAA